MTARSLRSSLPAAATAVAVIAVMVGALTACTKSSTGDTSSPPVSTQTAPSTPASVQPTGPIRTGKLVEKKATSCPVLSFGVAKNDGGMRLSKVTTLTQDGVFAGCRFYPAVFQSEHLPPTSQVVIEVLISQYASADAAHNAFIRIAEAGTSVQQAKVASSNTGLCYQTTLWAPDRGQDWACTFAKGTKVVVIRTVVNKEAFSVQEIAQAVYPKV